MMPVVRINDATFADLSTLKTWFSTKTPSETIDRLVREAMEQLLAGWGYEVVTASSGIEAIELLASRPTRPDLIISDYRLRDGETGIAAIENLRSEYNVTIPALLVTGDTAPDRLAEAEASNLLLLHKPVPNSRLRAAMLNLIAHAQKSEDDD